MTPAEMARQLDAQCEGWLVWHGQWSRRYWAIACWVRETQVLINAADPVQLLDLMTQIEAKHPKQARYEIDACTSSARCRDVPEIAAVLGHSDLAHYITNRL